MYASDSTTIDLCLSVFPWARFRARKAAIKMHTLLDVRGPIPTFIAVSDGKLHDVNILDAIVPEPGSFYSGVLFRRRYSHPIDPATGLRSDHTVVLASADSSKHYPDPLRRIHYHDA